MNVLLTGATGYIGKNLLERLLKEEHEVTIIKRKTSKLLKSYKKIKEVIFDGTYESLEKGIEIKPDVVIHLATCFLANHTSDKIEDLIDSNILFGTYLLEYMAKNSIKYFINTETYAESLNGKEYNPQNLYSATKMAFKDILKFYADDSRLKIISLVLSDTYGPGDTRKKFINLTIEAIKNKNNIFNMSLGEQEICYVYIEDVVEAYIRAIEILKEIQEKEIRTYSVFGNEIVTLNELVSIVEEVFNYKLNCNKGFFKYRNREIMKFDYNIDRLLGWSPKVILKEGIKKL